MGKQKLSIKKVKSALEQTGGMPTYAAKILGVTYQAIWKFSKDNPQLQYFREAGRAKLHEDAESMMVFAIKTGYIQKAIVSPDGKPTSETVFEEVDVRTRLNMAQFIMNQYKRAAGIKNEVDITSDGKALNSNLITVIELPEKFRPKNEV